MADLELQELPQRLQEGVILVERGALDQAQMIFAGYLERHPESSVSLSYAGLLACMKDRQASKGLQFCQEAVRRDPGEALCHLNLSKIYFTVGDRYQCVRSLHRGLKIRSPYRPLLMGFYRTIGLRRKPVLPFLSRNNVLNNLLGRLTWRLKGLG